MQYRLENANMLARCLCIKIKMKIHFVKIENVIHMEADAWSVSHFDAIRLWNTLIHVIWSTVDLFFQMSYMKKLHVGPHINNTVNIPSPM